MALGSLLGGGIGAGAGALLGNPMLGAQLGATAGGLVEGAVKNRQANNMQIPLTDPLQTRLYQDLENKRKQLDAGTTYLAQQDALKQAGGRSMSAVTNMTGGDVGATLAALRGVNRGTGRNLNELYSNMSLEGLKLLSMMDTLSEKIATRKLGLQTYDKLQKKAEGTQAIADATKLGMQVAASYLPVNPATTAKTSGTPSVVNPLATANNYNWNMFTQPTVPVNPNPIANYTMDANQLTGMPTVTPPLGGGLPNNSASF